MSSHYVCTKIHQVMCILSDLYFEGGFHKEVIIPLKSRMESALFLVAIETAPENARTLSALGVQFFLS